MLLFQRAFLRPFLLCVRPRDLCVSAVSLLARAPGLLLRRHLDTSRADAQGIGAINGAETAAPKYVGWKPIDDAIAKVCVAIYVAIRCLGYVVLTGRPGLSGQ